MEGDGAKTFLLDFFRRTSREGASSCFRCRANLSGLTFGPCRMGLAPRIDRTPDLTFRIGVGLPSWASLIVSAIELRDSIGVIVFRDTGEKSKPVTRSTSLSVAEATRRKVLPIISICQMGRLTPCNTWNRFGKPANIWRRSLDRRSLIVYRFFVSGFEPLGLFKGNAKETIK